MEAAVEVRKPRLTYQQFQAQQKSSPTLATLIFRYIEEMKSVKPCGASQVFTLGLTARSPLGAKPAAEITNADAIAYVRMRRQQFVKNTTRFVGPATVGQEISYICVVLKYASAAWADCAKVKASPVIDAKPFLTKQGLIAKSTPRDRRPTDEEIATLERLAIERNRSPRTRIDLLKLARWQIASARRVSETCRLWWLGWNPDAQTMVVTKVKDPRTRDKTKTAALTDAAQLMLFELAHEINAGGPDAWNDPAMFVFHWHGQQWNSKCASQAYADLKTKAGIKGLRLHDSRRETSSRLVEGGCPPAAAILVTLHETTAVFERNYMRLKPENFRKMANLAEAEPILPV